MLKKDNERNRKKVVILGTLDTKGAEVKYIKEKIEENGLECIVVDIGIRGPPREVTPNITREEVANAAGYTIEELASLPRGEAIKRMSEGVKAVCKKLYESKKLDGIISIGGADGSLLAAAGITNLPIGVPKVMISPVFQGEEKFGPFVGTRDVIMIHSVVDILGLNDIIKVIFDNAVVALVNMVKSRDVYVDYEFKNKNLISVTMYGNTTPGVMIAKELLEERGYQVVVFHPNGTGGRAMEEMIYEGLFKGVLDYTPHEVVDYLLNGLHSAGPERLDAAIKTGVPLVLVPGCCDFILKGPLNTLPKKYRKRLIYGFNPLYTLVKVSIEEAKMIGRYIANKLNNAKEKSKIAVVFPLKGISMYDKEGDLFFDPEVDKAIFNSIKKNISPEIRIVEVDAHINEWPVPKTCVEILLELIEKENL